VEQLERLLATIKEDNRVRFFDAVLVHGSEMEDPLAGSAELRVELHQARFVLLCNIHTLRNHENHIGLLTDPKYALIAGNPDLRNGYAIFGKHTYAGDEMSGGPDVKEEDQRMPSKNGKG
jgi:hypothetical protein